MRLHTMSWLTAALTVAAGAARVGAATTTPPPERTEQGAAPPLCELFKQLPADSRSETLQWEQQLSLASCRQSLAVRPTSNPAAYESMVKDIDRAMQPSIELYTDILAHAPTPELRLLAAYGLGMTHLTSIVRARSAIDVPATDAEGVPIDRYHELHDPLEPLLDDNRAAAISAFNEADKISEQSPDAAHANPVTQYAISDARTQLGLLELSPETTPKTTQR